MNCEYVDRLLPLYAGHDLEGELSRLVATHLQSCRECSRVVDEYAGANRLLQGYEPPFVSEDVYAGIRRQVVNKIKRKSPMPLWQFLTPFVQPRLRWITAVLLLAMSLTAVYLVARRSNQRSPEPQVAQGSGTVDRNAPKSPDPSKTDRSNKEDSSASRHAPVTGNKAGNTGNRSKTGEKGAVVTTTTRVLPNKRPVHSEVHRSQPLLTRAPVRVEMQTRNPNIRIIWLPTRPLDPGARETSKGMS